MKTRHLVALGRSAKAKHVATVNARSSRFVRVARLTMRMPISPQIFRSVLKGVYDRVSGDASNG